MTSFRFLANERTFHLEVKCGRASQSEVVHYANHLVPVSQEPLSFKSNMASLPFVSNGLAVWEAISVKSGMRSRLVIEKSIATVEFIDW